MLYAVGTRIDLRHLNGPQQQAEALCEAVPDRSREVIPGTTLSFIKMASGLIVTKITEPAIALRVSVSA